MPRTTKKGDQPVAPAERQLTDEQKTDVNIAHFIKRMRQRQKLTLTPDQVRQIANIVKRGKSELVCHTSTSRTRHIVNWNGRRLLIAYDNKRHVPVTVLTDKARVRYEEKMAKMKGDV